MTLWSGRKFEAHEIADLQTPPSDDGGAPIVSVDGDVCELFGLDHFKTIDVGNQHLVVWEIVGVSLQVYPAQDRQHLATCTGLRRFGAVIGPP